MKNSASAHKYDLLALLLFVSVFSRANVIHIETDKGAHGQQGSIFEGTTCAQIYSHISFCECKAEHLHPVRGCKFICKCKKGGFHFEKMYPNAWTFLCFSRFVWPTEQRAQAAPRGEEPHLILHQKKLHANRWAQFMEVCWQMFKGSEGCGSCVRVTPRIGVYYTIQTWGVNNLLHKTWWAITREWLCRGMIMKKRRSRNGSQNPSSQKDKSKDWLAICFLQVGLRETGSVPGQKVTEGWIISWVLLFPCNFHTEAWNITGWISGKTMDYLVQTCRPKVSIIYRSHFLVVDLHRWTPGGWQA